MAELADAHGSGPCEGNFMEVRILLSAPIKTRSKRFEFFLWFLWGAGHIQVDYVHNNDYNELTV